MWGIQHRLVFAVRAQSAAAALRLLMLLLPLPLAAAAVAAAAAAAAAVSLPSSNAGRGLGLGHASNLQVLKIISAFALKSLATANSPGAQSICTVEPETEIH